MNTAVNTAAGTAGRAGGRAQGWRRPAWLEVTGEWARERLRLLDSPLATHHVLLATTSLLVVIGLVMVLSSSSVESLEDNGSQFTYFKSQATFAVLGALVLVVASRVPATAWRRLALPALAGAALLQLLVFVPGIGHAVNGNRNWIRVAGLSAQPSEAAKVALVLACSLALARKRDRLHEPGQLVGALLPSVTATIGLVLLARDLGTALVMMFIVVAMLWTAGVPGRFFALAGGAGAALVAALVVTSENRMRRVQDWLTGTATSGVEIQGASWQPVQGQYALASGGWWGLGLGASREKWQWLPEAHNDFIFAIIGEELGLPGTLVVLVLFAVLALAALRLVRRSADLFTKFAVTGFAAWILGQACLNIGVVLGVLPVIGVPLPFISHGGTALVVALLAVGILLSFARAEPGAPEALRARESVVARSLAVLPRRVRRSR
ncbi:putative lipid II flippase FtsW [Kineococcus sp. TRM81007]|uniref:putative lipid II flippase FtsW n=1 Tax=Kineococcus sp. TRM81007 TaxID=2925831 RepID=UPI001F5737DB|nr:putative lipid II flippase FtsW [Kineococcus sp. TRM81007]MCI2239704.1 putative lipid II flippase FtsW [Kineococcus sp. TRM81007]